MNCPSCQTDTGDTDRACPGCGEPLQVRPGWLIADRYEVQAALGEGGMGAVFRARDRALQVSVALKVLRLGADVGAVKRFHHEVTLARKVRHENVCGVYEYGEDHGLVFLTMELVAGRNLRQLLRERGPLPLDRAYDLALKAARGLEAIHEAGVLHRDLKTSNIMVDARDRVRLVDFGIARALPAETLDETPTTPSAITDRNVVVGTPEYMSPEQVRGWPLDERSDIYSFGVVLFELFTGRLPFQGSSRAATMLKHLDEPPPLEGSLAALLPAALVPVLARALAKDPDQRQGSLGELIRELEEARTAFRTETFDAMRVPSWKALAPLVLVPFVGVALYFLLRSIELPAHPSPSSTTMVASTSTTATPVTTLPVTLPPATVASRNPPPVKPAIARPPAPPPTLAEADRPPSLPPSTLEMAIAPPSTTTPPTTTPPTTTPPSTIPLATVPTTTNLSQDVEVSCECLSCSDPPYPPVAERMKLQGEVEMEITVDEKGKVTAARVLSGKKVFSDPSQKAVRSWRFQPATRNGVPVSCTLRHTIKFRLSR